MNSKVLMIGGLALAGVAGIYLYSKSNTQVVTETVDTPLLISGTGTGINASSINSGTTGQTTINSGISELTGLAQLQSANDLTAAIAQTNATRDVALAGIASDTQLGLADKNLTFMQGFLDMVPQLKKLGISSIGGAGGLGAGVVYTDPKKNLSYATGFDSMGNLMGQGPDGGSMILQVSAQQAYNNSLVTQANGVVGTGSSVTVGANPKGIKPIRKNKNTNIVTVPLAGA